MIIASRARALDLKQIMQSAATAAGICMTAWNETYHNRDGGIDMGPEIKKMAPERMAVAAKVGMRNANNSFLICRLSGTAAVRILLPSMSAIGKDYIRNRALL